MQHPSIPVRTEIPVQADLELREDPQGLANGHYPATVQRQGSKMDCSNFRGITLLSVPGKVFAHITGPHQAPHSCEAAPGAKWIDGGSYPDPRILAQTRIDYHQPLYAAYVDLNAAFDSVDRGVLWKLKILGLLPKIQSIIEALYMYSNTVSRVRTDGDTGDYFPIKFSVLQGCILAPECFDY